MKKLKAFCLALTALTLGFGLVANSEESNAPAESAISHIKVGTSAPNCGKGGKTPYIKNNHGSASILVNLHVRYSYNGQSRDTSAGSYRVNSGKTRKLTSKCSIPGPTNQTFTYYAKSASY